MAAGLTVSDVQVLGKVGGAEGGSSVGAFVASSKGVRFVRAKLEAQAGGAAKDGVLASFSYPAPVRCGDAPDASIGGAAARGRLAWTSMSSAIPKSRSTLTIPVAGVATAYKFDDINCLHRTDVRYAKGDIRGLRALLGAP